MVFPVLFAVVLALLKGYKLKPLLKAYTLYPFAVLTIILLFLQISVFFQNYTFIKYAATIKTVYLVSLILPYFFYRLYKPGLVGSALIFAGTLLNKFVISQNGGKMPVYATLSKLTGYYSDSMIGTVDSIHSVADASTKYKILIDYIDIGYSILSIGDMMIHSFVFIILYYTIKELNNSASVPTLSKGD